MKVEYLLTLIIFATIIVAGIIISLFVLYPKGLSPSSKNYIFVSASGFAYGTATQAQLYLTVNGTGSTTQVATANISLTLAKINASLSRYLNGNMSLAQTQYYNIYKQYNRSGFVATTQLLINIPNINNVTPILTDLSYVPNVYINNVQAKLSDQDVTRLRNEALTSAMENATSQARVIAGNQTLAPTNITISSYVVYPYQYYYGAAASAAPGPAYFPGINQVRESINVVFRYGR